MNLKTNLDIELTQLRERAAATVERATSDIRYMGEKALARLTEQARLLPQLPAVAELWEKALAIGTGVFALRDHDQWQERDLSLQIGQNYLHLMKFDGKVFVPGRYRALVIIFRANDEEPVSGHDE